MRLKSYSRFDLSEVQVISLNNAGKQGEEEIYLIYLQIAALKSKITHKTLDEAVLELEMDKRGNLPSNTPPRLRYNAKKYLDYECRLNNDIRS